MGTREVQVLTMIGPNDGGRDADHLPSM